MATTLGLFCAAIVGVSVLGGVLPLAAALTHTRLQVYLSVSAGAMLGAAFFHMMPEAVRAGSPATLRWSAVGLLALFFLERFFAFHHHEAPADPEEPCPPHRHEHAHGGGHSAGLVHASAPGGSRAQAKGASLHWGAAGFGLAAHSLAGGVALASAVAAGRGLRPGPGAAAWGVFLATLVHKPADALTIVSLMLRAGAPKPLAHLVNLGFALMIPAGVAAFLLGLSGLGPEASASVTAAALAFSAGTFLCIALSDLLPELQFHAHDRLKLSIALLAGFALMAATAAAEPHGQSHQTHHKDTKDTKGAQRRESKRFTTDHTERKTEEGKNLSDRMH
jgi:zinc and cadmium transporter